MWPLPGGPRWWCNSSKATTLGHPPPFAQGPPSTCFKGGGSCPRCPPLVAPEGGGVGRLIFFGDCNHAKSACTPQGAHPDGTDRVVCTESRRACTADPPHIGRVNPRGRRCQWPWASGTCKEAGGGAPRCAAQGAAGGRAPRHCAAVPLCCAARTLSRPGELDSHCICADKIGHLCGFRFKKVGACARPPSAAGSAKGGGHPCLPCPIRRYPPSVAAQPLAHALALCAFAAPCTPRPQSACAQAARGVAGVCARPVHRPR